MALGDHLCGGADGFRFIAIEAAGVDEFFDIGLLRVGEGGGSGILAEEGGRGFVDAFIRALGGENRGDEQFERVFVDEGAVGIGVGFGEFAIDGTGTFDEIGIGG